MVSEKQHELELLEAVEADPETSQADLASKAGVAVGTVNWYLKRWAAKGYVKIKRIGRWRWKYLLTPEGVTEKTRLAGEYIEASLALYRKTRRKAKHLLRQIQVEGYGKITLDGGGEIAEIIRLTCLELGLKVVDDSERHNVPTLRVKGTQLELIWADTDSEDRQVSGGSSHE